jgi:hypothetical protein
MQRRSADVSSMSIPLPVTPHDGDDRDVADARARPAVRGRRSRSSEVERLRALLAAMPDERWTTA